MYELYFMRHGIAANKELPIYKNNDPERPLTDEGIKKITKIAKGLKKIVKKLDIIYSSPYKRALQTAQIVSKKFNPEIKIITIDELMPNKSLYELTKFLSQNTSAKKILLVGHETFLSEYISFLLKNNVSIKLKKGAVCRVDVDSLKSYNKAELIWLIQPAIFFKLLKEKK